MNESRKIEGKKKERMEDPLLLVEPFFNTKSLYNKKKHNVIFGKIKVLQ